jgi:hypothetical protein
MVVSAADEPLMSRSRTSDESPYREAEQHWISWASGMGGFDFVDETCLEKGDFKSTPPLAGTPADGL